MSLTALIPKMTSANTPSGVASASSVYGGYTVWAPFAQTFESWISADGTHPLWLRYQSAQAITATHYALTVHTNSAWVPTEWTLQGSNDGTNWTDLDTRTGQGTSVYMMYAIAEANVGSYLYHQLLMTAGSAVFDVIYSFQLYAASVATDPNKVLSPDGNATLPASGNVLLGSGNYGNPTSPVTPTFDESARNIGTGAANILVGSSVTIQNSPIVGTFNEASRNSGTTAINIANGVTIKIQNVTTTGTATLETHAANQIIDTAGGLWSTANVIPTNIRIGYTAGANNTIIGTLVPGSGSNAPNAATVNVTDARNGATANIAVTGADGGTINRVYSAPIDGGVWTLRATISGNGTAQANLAVDSYAWVVVSDSGTGNTVSNPDFAAINPVLVYTRTNRKVETAARNMVRKCKRGWGVQVWWINGRDDDGRQLYAMRGKFTRGIGLSGVDLDIERATFFIPRQYDGAGGLLFPVITSNTVEDVTPQSRLYYAGKTYEVQLVSGDVEGMPETAVFRCDCIRRMYNPFVQDFTPPYSNLTPEESAMATIWETITANTAATVNHGYFVDTTTNAVTLTLPANPTLGWSCWVNVLNRTNLTTITASGGLTIMGTDSVTIDYDNVGFQVVYSPSSNGWRIVTEI
jgi:hypothetical protein